MRYTRREVRMIDTFALILAGVGGLFVILGFAAPTPMRVKRGPSVKGERRVVLSESPKYPKGGRPARTTSGRVVRPGKGKGKPGMLGAVHPLLLIGCCFIALGTALHLGVKRVLRNRLEDVVGPHDEPDVKSGRPPAKDSAAPAHESEARK
jgi:hypothetical protein